MKTIKEHIKKQEFAHMYLLYGNEAYLRYQYRDLLVTALVEDVDSMNYTKFVGKEISPFEVVDLACTLPFFAEKRVIVIEDSAWFLHAVDDFTDHIDEIPETTVMIFVEEEIDKRSRLYKKIGAVGYATEMKTPSGKELMQWVQGLIRKEGKEIDGRGLQLFMEQVGTDMNQIRLELEKLICYTLEQDCISYQDVELICVNQVTNKIFAMMDAIGGKRQLEAMSYYHDLLELREKPMLILHMLTRQYRILLTVKKLTEQGVSSKEMASKAGIPPFTVRNYMEQAKLYEAKELKQLLEACQDTDAGIKRGLYTDVIGLELLIVEFSNKKTT